MIALVKSVTKKVPALRYLNSLALKYIFDNYHLTLNEERLLNEGIRRWLKKAVMTAYEKRELNVIISCLIQDKEGRFDGEKFAYKKGDIDYRKVYSEGI